MESNRQPAASETSAPAAIGECVRRCVNPIEDAGCDLLALLRCSGSDAEVRAHAEHRRDLNREVGVEPRPTSSFGTETAAIMLLCGLVAFGQIVIRRIDGREHLAACLAKEWIAAA